MAEVYLEEIRACQPKGPYVLGGYAGGGLVALEMARRVTESRQTVALLVLIDTLPPDAPVRKMTLGRRLERTTNEGLRYLRGAMESEIALRRAHRRREEASRFASAGVPVPAALREAHLVACFEKAAARYRARPWAGHAILLRAEKIEYVLADVDPGYGWEHIISDLEISIVPGTHDDLLLVPHPAALVKALGRAIEETTLQRDPCRSPPRPAAHGAASPVASALRLGDATPRLGGLGAAPRDRFTENGHGTLPGVGDDVPPASV
jgi:thioesterase domain-containing protein